MAERTDDSLNVSGLWVGILFVASISVLFLQAPISSALRWAWFLAPFFIVLRFACFAIALISALALIRLKATWLPMAILLFWCWGVSTEGYYFAFGGGGAPFVPKPWQQGVVNRWLDLTSPTLLGKLWADSQFLFAALLCTAVQLAQAGVGFRAGIGHLPKTEQIVLRIIAGFCYALDLFSALRTMPPLTASPASIVGFVLQFGTMIFGFELLLIALFAGFSGIDNYFNFLSGKLPTMPQNFNFKGGKSNATNATATTSPNP